MTRSIRSAALALAWLGPLVVYALTRAPDLGSIDSGELAAVCTNLQIAHPTGYPLYTLLGRVAVLVLPGPTPIARLNLLSGLLAALSALGVFLLFRCLVQRIRPAAPAWAGDLLSLAAAWLWSIHPALWSQAAGNEVHPLQAALVALLLAAAVRAGGMQTRLLVAYLLGLALTNHMTVLFLVPGLLAWALSPPGGRLLRQRSFLLAGAGLGLLALLLYLYLPLRSRWEPWLDWGDPTSPARFLRHVAATQYQVWLFASAEGFAANLVAFLRELVSPSSLPLLPLGLAGAIGLARHDRPSAALLGGGFLVGSVWASGYEIHDLEPYYLIPRLCLAGLAVAGAAHLLPNGPGPRRRLVWLALPLLAAVLLGALRWSDQSRRGDRFVRLYAESLLRSLPENALLLTRHWDIVVSPALYLQQIEGIRTDVTVVDTELLRRSWYFPQLRRSDGSLLEPIEGRVALFLEQLELFEGRRSYDPRRIEERYRSVIAGLYEAHRLSRPIFHTPEVEPFYAGSAGVPEAQAVRVVADPRLSPEVAPLDPAVWKQQARFVDEPVRRTAWAFLIELGRSRVLFLEQLDRAQEAERWREVVGRFEAIPLGRNPAATASVAAARGN